MDAALTSIVGTATNVRVVDDPATARDEALQRGLTLAAATP